MWDLIVSVPDHCLSFYFITVIFPSVVRNLLRHIFMESFICDILSVLFIPIILSRSTFNVIPNSLN